MIKVFLVDNDVSVIDELKNNIPWEEHGFTLAGEAADGEMALPLIRKIKPDLLITAVDMPFMNGLALSKLVNRECPETKIVVISDNDSFKYAQQAIEYGVFRYLLKPVKIDNILDALCAVKQRLKREQEQREHLHRLTLETQEYEQYSRRKLFEQMTMGALTIEEIYEKATSLGMSLDASGYNIVLFSVQSKVMSDEYAESISRLLKDIEKTLNEYSEYLVFQWNIMSYAILIKGDMQELDQLARRCGEIVRKRCDIETIPIDWCVAVSRPVQRLSSLPQCLATVKRILAHRHFAPHKHILTEQILIRPTEDDEIKKLDSIDAAKIDPMLIRSFMQTGLSEEAEDFVVKFLDDLGDAADNTAMRQYIVLSARFNAALIVSSLGYSQQDFLNKLKPVPTEISTAQLKDHLITTLRKVTELRDRESKNQHHNITKNALRYIDQNFSDEGMSLNTVAKVVNVSTNYFSTIFSQEIGMSFVEYLTQKRMEKAKQLLRQTGKRSGEIAFEVGYRDPRYFSYIFKKTQGCTPRDYRAGKTSND